MAVALVLITSEVALGAGVLSTRLGDRPRQGAGVAVQIPADLSGAALGEKDATAIRELLARRATALLYRDRAAFMADVDSRDATFSNRQRALFENIQDVPLASWEYEVRLQSAVRVGAAVRRYGADVWVGEVDLRYALAGYDQEQVTAKQYLTFVRRRGRWLLGGDDDGANAADAGARSMRGPWDFAPVAVTRGARGAVLARPSDADLAKEVAAALDEAVAGVSAAWHGWRGRPVVVIAGSADEVRALVPGESDLRQIAAITATELGPRGAALGERVVINPVPFRALSAELRRIVVRHEVTHLATAATTSASTPAWLAEGYADHLAYTSRRVNPVLAAPELAAQVRAGRPPGALPSEGEFAPENPSLSSAYQASWLACRFIAARIGDDGLARFYRTVSGGPGDADASLDSGLRSMLQMTSEEFLVQWVAYVRAQLR